MSNLSALLRRLTLATMLSVVVGAAAIAIVYRRAAADDQIKQGAQANLNVGSLAVNAISSALQTPLTLHPWLISAKDDPARTGWISTTDLAIRGMLDNTAVLRMNLYDARGSVIYSTEPSLIGRDLSSLPAFQQALAGETVASLTHHDWFAALGGDLAQRDVLSTFEPLRRMDGRITAVAEVFIDATLPLAHAQAQQRRVTAIVGGVAAAVCFTIILLLRRSGGLLKRHRDDLLATQAELSTARDVAEQATRAKSAFLAAMSHEIRTPMNGVLGMTELLSRTELNGEQQRYVGALMRSGRSLLTLLNDLLDYSKIEAQRLDLEARPFELRQVFEDGLELIASAAAEKGLRLRLEVSPALPAWVLGDALRVQQIVNNLLSNAVKFTDRGEIRLSARPAAPGSDATVEIEVADTGCGIDTATLDKLFKPFTQGEVSSARRREGTGLGLAIAQQLAQAMGGQIRVVSAPGSGSRFIVWAVLPETLPQRAPVGDGMAAGTKRRLRVLVAEDNPVNQLYARIQLEHLGHEVVVVEDGVQAVDHMASESFDIVLMDCQMPEMDGYAATRERRRAEAAESGRSRLYIVALTASAMADDRQRCAESGMDAFLCKPFDRHQLMATLAPVEAGVAARRRHDPTLLSAA